MNLCKVPNPISFTGKISQNWKDFEFVLSRRIMLSRGGKEAREVYKTLLWAAEGDEKKFNKVIAVFKAYCEPWKNVLYEHHSFWNLHQLEEETVDAYLIRLKIKVDSCDYNQADWPPAVRLEMLRDGFVFGLRYDTWLLRETELNLTKVHRDESLQRNRWRRCLQSHQSMPYQKVRDYSTAQSTVTVLRCNLVVVVDKHISQNN